MNWLSPRPELQKSLSDTPTRHTGDGWIAVGSRIAVKDRKSAYFCKDCKYTFFNIVGRTKNMDCFTKFCFYFWVKPGILLSNFPALDLAFLLRCT